MNAVGIESSNPFCLLDYNKKGFSNLEKCSGETVCECSDCEKLWEVAAMGFANPSILLIYYHHWYLVCYWNPSGHEDGVYALLERVLSVRRPLCRYNTCYTSNRSQFLI